MTEECVGSRVVQRKLSYVLQLWWKHKDMECKERFVLDHLMCFILIPCQLLSRNQVSQNVRPRLFDFYVFIWFFYIKDTDQFILNVSDWCNESCFKFSMCSNMMISCVLIMSQINAAKISTITVLNKPSKFFFSLILRREYLYMLA